MSPRNEKLIGVAVVCTGAFLLISDLIYSPAECAIWRLLKHHTHTSAQHYGLIGDTARAILCSGNEFLTALSRLGIALLLFVSLFWLLKEFVVPALKK